MRDAGASSSLVLMGTTVFLALAAAAAKTESAPPAERTAIASRPAKRKRSRKIIAHDWQSIGFSRSIAGHEVTVHYQFIDGKLASGGFVLGGGR
jgi:hypothetical protein